MAVNYTADGKIDMVDQKNMNAETIVAFFKLSEEKVGAVISPASVEQFFKVVMPHYAHLRNDVEALLFGNAKRGFRWNT